MIGSQQRNIKPSAGKRRFGIRVDRGKSSDSHIPPLPPNSQGDCHYFSPSGRGGALSRPASKRFALGCRVLNIVICLLALALTVGLQAAVYEKYLFKGNPLDDQILKILDELKSRPESSELHNNLGAKLMEKQFPKDSMREFKKAVRCDGKNYQAWFNLGLAHESMGNTFRALRAFKKTLKYKKGHDLAHYHVGMIYERWGFTHAAIRHYAAAIRFNPKIIDVAYNPAIVDNDMLPRVFSYIYKRYRTSTLQPYQMLPVPPAPAVEPAKAAVPSKETPKKPQPPQKGVGQKKEAVMQPQTPPAAPEPAPPPPVQPAPPQPPEAPPPAQPAPPQPPEAPPPAK